jgi:hypothetical protein
MRLKVWIICAITLIGAVLLHIAILVATGFDPFNFTMLFLVPVGTLATGALALSGFYLGAKRYAFRPGLSDLVFLSVVSVSLILLIGLADYAATGAYAAGESVGHFLRSSVTETRYITYMRGMPTNAPPVKAGDAGWMLLMIRVAALLAIAKVVHMSLSEESTQWQR